MPGSSEVVALQKRVQALEEKVAWLEKQLTDALSHHELPGPPSIVESVVGEKPARKSKIQNQRGR